MFLHKTAPLTQLLVMHKLLLVGDLVPFQSSTTTLFHNNQLEHTQRKPRFGEGISLGNSHSVTYHFHMTVT